MSNEYRIPDQIISMRAPRVDGKIRHELLPKMKVEMFGAYQFRGKHNRMSRNFTPTVPIRPEEKEAWYLNMFRLRINEKWYVPGTTKYSFFSMPEIIELIICGELHKNVAK